MEVVCRPEVVDPAVRHERLEPDHAAVGEFFQLVQVVRRQAAPQREVRPAIRLRRGDFGVEGGGVQHRRGAVERHVEEQRSAAGAQGCGAGVEALPVGAAGLVEVDVRVDHAGENVQASRVDGLLRAAAQVAADLDDRAVLDRHVDVHHAVG